MALHTALNQFLQSYGSKEDAPVGNDTSTGCYSCPEAQWEMILAAIPARVKQTLIKGPLPPVKEVFACSRLTRKHTLSTIEHTPSCVLPSRAARLVANVTLIRLTQQHGRRIAGTSLSQQ
jgi:hypothetical protein